MKTIFSNLLSLAILAVLVMSCSDDEPTPIVPDAGTISGGPFTFQVDGVVDNVSGVSVSGDLVGTNSSFVITDDQNNILGLPGTVTDLEGVDFDGAGVGVCFIWYIRYEDGLTGLEQGASTNNLDGTFDLSNSIMVSRNMIMASTIEGGPFTFVVDGTTDNVSGVTVDDSNVGSLSSTWVVTDEESNILGLPGTVMDLEGVNFDGAGAGVCFIWHLTYGEGLMGLEAGANVSDLTGNYALSNSIMVTRASAGEVAGGPFTFIVDGTVDNVSGLSVTMNQDLANTGYIVTDDQNNILGLPPTMEALGGVDFDGAGAGVCLIWRITYEDGLTGLETEANVSGLEGTYSLSNSVTVTRVSAGMIAGGPFTFTVDGTVDNVSGITVSGNQDLANTGYVVTDDQNNILGLPPTIEALQGVDFDAAGTGVCLIWRITYEDGLMGLSAGENTSGISGTFSLSNSITVTRN